MCHWLTPQGRRLLADADLEVELRLRQIAELRPDGGEDAYAGLGSWQVALDAHRVRCAAARCAAASTPTAAIAASTATAQTAAIAASTASAQTAAIAASTATSVAPPAVVVTSTTLATP